MSFKSRKKLLTNIVALAVPNMLKPFVSLIVVYFISRRLGVDGMGQYSLLSSYTNMFTSVASLGLGTLIVREASRHPEKLGQIISNSFVIGAISWLVMMVFMDSFVLLMGYDRYLLVALGIGSVSILPGIWQTYVQSGFRSLERSGFIAAGQLLETFLKVVLCSAVVLLGYGIIAISAVTAFTKIFSLGFLVFMFVRYSGVIFGRLNKAIFLLLAREAPTFIGISVCALIFMNIDIILLSKLVDVHAVGIYDGAYRIILICLVGPVAFAMAILPVLSQKAQAKGLERKGSITVRAVYYLLVLYVPASVGIIILADRLIMLIYGAEFKESVFILQMLAPCLIPLSIIPALSQALISVNHQRIDLAINFGAALMSTVLNLALIVCLSETGSAIARVLSVSTLAGAQIWFINRNLFIVRPGRLIRKPLLASAIMGVVTYFLHDFNLIFNYVVSTSVYFILLLIMRGLYPEEMVFLKDLLRKARWNW